MNDETDKPEQEQSWTEAYSEMTSEGNNASPNLVSVAEVLQQAIEQVPEVDVAELADVEPGKETRGHKIYALVQGARQGLSSVGADLVHFAGDFHVFVGTHWARTHGPPIRSFLAEASVQAGTNEAEAYYHRFVDDLERQAASVTAIEQAGRDPTRHLMNFLNGTLEVRPDGTTEFREHRADDMITYALPHAYDPEAMAPGWGAFLDKTVPHPESQMNLAEFVGSAFTSLKHEKALILLGDGHNGKSVFADVVAGVLGPHNVTHESIESLNSGYHRAAIAGYLLNYATEIGRNPKPEILKKMISGEPVDARLPYGKPFIMRNYARLAFNANELPKDVEHTSAFFRRLLIIPFEVRISESERIRTSRSGSSSKRPPGCSTG